MSANSSSAANIDAGPETRLVLRVCSSNVMSAPSSVDAQRLPTSTSHMHGLSWMILELKQMQ